MTISDATLKVNPVNSKQVVITLGSYNLKDGKFYKVVASNIVDVFGNALDTDNNNAICAALAVAAPAAPTIYEYNTATNNIKLVFSEEMVAAEAQKAANYTVQGEVNPVLSASYSWDAAAGKATVVLNLTNALTVPRAVALNAAVTNLGLKPLAALVVAAPASVGDGVAPTVDTVVAKTLQNAANDVITITFKDKDILAASGRLSANYVVKDPAGSVISSAKYTLAFVDGGAGVDSVTITFDKVAPYDYNLQYNKSYTVTVSNVVDESGNVIAATTKTATWDPASDKLGPTLNAVLAVNAGTKTFTVTYLEDIDATTASDKANYTIVYSANGTYSDTVTLTPIFATYNAVAKTADIIVSEAVSTALGGSKFKVTIKNVKDLAGNVSDGTLAGHSAEITN